MNNQYSLNQYQTSMATANTEQINNYFKQKEAPKKEETGLTKQMKRQFSFFGPASIIYALFYTFCLYKNASGITYPFFVAGTLYYFFLSMKKLGVPYKKGSLFYVISIILLGISNCCTTSVPLLKMNKLGIFLLFFILMLHTVYQDTDWTLPKYMTAILRTIFNSVTCLLSPFQGLASFFDAKKQVKSDKKNYFFYIIIGIAISIPVLFVMIMLLCSADVVFGNIMRNLFSFDISFTDMINIPLLITVVFFASYALLSALCRKTVNEDVSEKKVLEPIIAIIVTGMLSVVYLMFSMIQILYLFIGKMKLPDGYTYSSYARQGFFQLLAVCIINLILVLICLRFFKDNMILKIILTVISGCTFIMILSSTLRMLMYIEEYDLTFLRIFVLWALAVIFLLMTGVTIYIHFQRFPLFFYSILITTVLYIGLSFAHPDYWIARYNLAHAHGSYTTRDYLYELSTDATPAILDASKNPNLLVDVQTLKNLAALEYKYTYEEYSSKKQSEAVRLVNSTMKEAYGDAYWIGLYHYYEDIYKQSKRMDIRNFNFSIFFAEKSAGL